MLNHRCSFEGWLLYDSHHAGKSENNAPGRADNWRATAWEIHPLNQLRNSTSQIKTLTLLPPAHGSLLSTAHFQKDTLHFVRII
jgi:hypothetical protein